MMSSRITSILPQLSFPRVYSSLALRILILLAMMLPKPDGRAQNHVFERIWPELPPWYFGKPTDVAIDSQGNVFVLEKDSCRIQVFNSSGTLLRRWGSLGRNDGQLLYPEGIAVDASGNVFVADTANDRIQVFSSSSAFLRKWGSSGWRDDQLDHPHGIAVDTSDNVFVADSSGRIKVFDSSGKFLRKWSPQGIGNSQGLPSPHHIAVDTSGDVFVTVDPIHHIEVFNSFGVLLREWGAYGSGDGQFRNPSGITVDTSGSVFVADSGNNRIQVFNSRGTFLRKWGTEGSGAGQLESPVGIAVDASGDVYVADTFNHRIQVFNSSGVWQRIWGIRGYRNGQFDFPCDVAVDPTGNVLVADTFNNRIQVFDSAGTFLRKWGSPGAEDGRFDWPYSIAIDTFGNVFVADIYNYRIQMFNSFGIFLGKWGGAGCGKGRFLRAAGIAIDANGNVFVADSDCHRIQKFIKFDGPPGAATPLAPNGNISTSVPTYKWNAVPGATWFHFRVDDATATLQFEQWYTADEALCISGTGVCTITPPIVLAPGNCRWRIHTYNSAGYGPWSIPLSFDVTTKPPDKATPISPAGLISQSVPIFSWNAVASATWYQLWVMNGNGSSKYKLWYTASKAGCGSGESICSVYAGSLGDGQYRWWIQALNYSGVGPWSEKMTFTVAQSMPQKAVLAFPSGNISTVNPIYLWHAANDATWYQLRVCDELGSIKFKAWFTAAEAGCAIGIGYCRITQSMQLSSGVYQWWIQTWNDLRYGPWSNAMQFTVTSDGIDVATDSQGNAYVADTGSRIHQIIKFDGPPGAATPLAPNGNISTSVPTYKWNAVPGATWFHIWINDSTATPKIDQWYTADEAFCASGMGVCTITPPIVLSSGDCRWWVQTYNGAGYGPWSIPLSFDVTIKPPDKATLISPTGSSIIHYSNFVWNAVTSATWYQLWVNDSGGSAAIKSWYTASKAGCGSGESICSVYADSLGDGQYRWWIETWTDNGDGPWSDGMTFTIGQTILGKAVLAFPSGNISTVNPIYLWHAATGATRYQLHVYDDFGFSKIKAWFTAAEAGCATGMGYCQNTPSIQLSPGAYQWWIQTWNESGYGSWSSLFSFTVTAPTDP